MSDDDETHLHVTYASHLLMDDAFCDRMRMAIEAGLESAPIGVVTTPGTQNPKYVSDHHVPSLRCSGLIVSFGSTSPTSQVCALVSALRRCMSLQHTSEISRSRLRPKIG